ncbi:hypothetical protein EW146_g10118 [Bondarzewia mesenterica]|uniref:Aminoglycoside phosphotransferase domain-containing protein n=1 Tax=Bondarzewia mesenterica TaxID=1095465 RepID=A0A4S4L0H6_9AGAM|nr:hypothetical protein EW146_g10118 [Bondarzewia mesenterica]
MLTLRAVSSYLSAPFASKSLRSMAVESHLSKRLLFGEQVFEPEKLSVYESTHSIPPAGEILPKPHYIDFNARALACAAADAISSNLPPRLSWFDWGGYNSVFLLTFDDGTEVIARIPHSRARIPSQSGVPPKMSSVVATMTFARYYCGIPCPRVLAWNSSGDNPVGAPYILMEKAEGEYPYARWGTVSEDRRLALIYFASPHLAEQRNIDDLDLGDPALYRVGPLAKGPGRLNHLAGLSSPSSSVRELWRDYVSSERAAAIAKWGSCRTTVIDVEEDQPDLDSEDEHTMGELLDAAEAIESMIATCTLPTDERLLAPCLVMNDYACRNVLSDPDSMQITSFIDWDEVALLPFFLCTRFPEEIADCPGGASRVETKTWGGVWVCRFSRFGRS